MSLHLLRRGLAAALLALLSIGAAQAEPVALALNPGYSLQAYTGSAAVNAGNLDQRDVLFHVREQRIGDVQSWYLFFDPAGVQSVQAVIDFGATILAVYSTSAQLAATRSTWQVDVDGDGLLDDYATTTLMGLEGEDRVSWVGSQLSLSWNAWDPGDHVRVLVQAVPEPGSFALAGLALAGLAAARRRKTV